MVKQPELIPTNAPTRAWHKPGYRPTDPETSREASAAAQSELKLRMQQTLLLKLISDHGPLTHAALWSIVCDTPNDTPPPMSQSGMRTRCSELVDMGLVVDSGKRERLPSGRRAILWGVVR